MKKISVVSIFLILFSFPLFGNGQSSDEDTIVVGFSIFDMQFEFFQQMETGTRDAVESRGWKYILHDQKSDASLMVSGIQDLLVQGLDLLIVCPYKPEALGPVVKAAHDQGIPVVINDIGGGDTPYDALVVSNNFEGGMMAADFVLENYSGTNQEAAIIKLDPSQTYSSMRGDGFKTVMEREGYEIVKELFCYGRSEEAYKIMQDILVAHPDVRIVFAEDDPTAAAASQAARDAGVDDILIRRFRRLGNRSFRYRKRYNGRHDYAASLQDGRYRGRCR